MTDSQDELRQLVERLGGLPSRLKLDSYVYNYRLPDGTRVSWGYLGADIRRVYIYLSPSKTDFAVLRQLLCTLRNVRVQRCDPALDYVGYNIQEYEFHFSRSGLSRHMLARNAHPHSYAFGEGRSHRRLAIYDKLEKCRADHIREARIVDVHGVVHRIPVSTRLEDRTDWFRVEARLRGRWILDGVFPRHGVFDDLIAKRRCAVSIDVDLFTEATLDYISRNPEAIRRLSRNARTKYRKYLRQLRDEHGLVPDPAEVFNENYSAICESLVRIRTLGSQAEGGCE